MPSGPKKRRAAKKKNDTIATTSANPTEEKPVDVVELSNVASNVCEMTIGDDVNTKSFTEMKMKDNEEKESSIEPTSEKIEITVRDDVFKCFLQDPPVFGNPFWLDVLKNAQMGLEGSGNGLSIDQLVVNEISSSNEIGDPFVESVPKVAEDSLKESSEITNHEPPLSDQPVLNDNVVCIDQTDIFGRVKILVNELACQSAEMKLLAEKQKYLSEEINLNLSKLMDEFNSEMPSRVTGVSKEIAKFDSQTTEPDVLVNEKKEHSKSFVNEKETFSPPKPEEKGSSYEHKYSSLPNNHKQFIHGPDFAEAYLNEQVIDNGLDFEEAYLHEQVVDNGLDFEEAHLHEQVVDNSLDFEEAYLHEQVINECLPGDEHLPQD